MKESASPDLKIGTILAVLRILGIKPDLKERSKRWQIRLIILGRMCFKMCEDNLSRPALFIFFSLLAASKMISYVIMGKISPMSVSKKSSIILVHIGHLIKVNLSML